MTIEEFIQSLDFEENDYFYHVTEQGNAESILEEELSNIGFRDTSELVILGAPKSCMKQIVTDFCDYKDGTFYEGVIHPDYVMGYFTRGTLEFTLNERFNYGTDAFYESLESRPF